MTAHYAAQGFESTVGTALSVLGVAAEFRLLPKVSFSGACGEVSLGALPSCEESLSLTTPWQPIDTAPDNDPVIIRDLATGQTYSCVNPLKVGNRLWMPFPRLPGAVGRQTTTTPPQEGSERNSA